MKLLIKSFLIINFLAIPFLSVSQHIVESLPNDVYLYPEKDAEFLYSEDSLYTYFKSNFNICKGSNINEQVVCRFYIETNGKASNLLMLTKNGDLFEDKLKNILYQNELWIPGLVKNNPVKCVRLLSLYCKNGALILPPYF